MQALSLNEAVADEFYDKTFNHLAVTRSLDAEGGSIRTVASGWATMRGNVQHTTRARVKELYGLDIDADITITTDPAVHIAIDDEIEYKDENYIVATVLERDSHTLIIGKRR